MDSILDKFEFDEKNIKNSDYTRSILSEAVRCGVISQAEMQTVRNGMSELFGEIMKGYDKYIGIRPDADIFSGQLFIFDVYLRSLDSHMEAVKALISRPLQDIRAEGVKLLKKTVAETMALLVKARQTRLPIDCRVYSQTLECTLKNALRQYDTEYFPQMICEGAEYPIYSPPYGLRGIFYLRAYVLGLIVENEFCMSYGKDELASLYSSLCSMRGVAEDEFADNIYSAVYANALLCEYLKKDPLSITAYDCHVIENLLGHMSESEEKAILQRAADLLPCSKLPYSLRSHSKMLPGMLKAVRHKRLNKYLVITE